MSQNDAWATQNDVYATQWGLTLVANSLRVEFPLVQCCQYVIPETWPQVPLAKNTKACQVFDHPVLCYHAVQIGDSYFTLSYTEASATDDLEDCELPIRNLPEAVQQRVLGQLADLVRAVEVEHARLQGGIRWAQDLARRFGRK